MKKADIAMIILIASVSVLIAYFVAKAIPGLSNASNQSVTVKTTDSISAQVDEPSPTVFNTNAINPTVEVIIGTDNSAGQ